MKTHELKILPEYYKAVSDKGKNFEYRINDRGYEVGDTLILKEYDAKRDRYTGSEKKATVSYIYDTNDRILSKQDGRFYSNCILSMTDIEIIKIGSPDGEHLSFPQGVLVRPQYISGTQRKAVMQSKKEEAEATSPVTSERVSESVKEAMKSWTPVGVISQTGHNAYQGSDGKVFTAQSIVDSVKKEILNMDNKDTIPQPHPFSANYYPGDGYWELFAPEPMSVNDMYVTITKGKGKGKRFLDNRAKMWKEKMKDAIDKEVGNHSFTDEGVFDLAWDNSLPMMIQVDWYNRGKREDLDGKIKLLQDSLSKTAVWQDDSQVQLIHARTVKDSMCRGAIKVLIAPYTVDMDNKLLLPWIERVS